MLKINKNYQNVKQSYLFSTIAKKTQAFLEQNPQADIIRMGIGDVKGPLPPAVTKAMEQANREMATEAGFHGYGPEQGYAFLKQPILQHYAEKGVTLSENEVFISDGAKSMLTPTLWTAGKLCLWTQTSKTAFCRCRAAKQKGILFTFAPPITQPAQSTPASS